MCIQPMFSRALGLALLALSSWPGTTTPAAGAGSRSPAPRDTLHTERAVAALPERSPCEAAGWMPVAPPLAPTIRMPEADLAATNPPVPMPDVCAPRAKAEPAAAAPLPQFHERGSRPTAAGGSPAEPE